MQNQANIRAQQSRQFCKWEKAKVYMENPDPIFPDLVQQKGRPVQ